MKKFIIFFSTALLISLIFTGCSNWGGNNPLGVTGGSEQGYGENSNLDLPEPGEDANSNLVGSWRHNFSSNDYTIITFSSNGAWESKVYYNGYLDEHYVGSYSVSDNNLTIIVEGESFTVTFSINDDELTLVFPDDGSIIYYRV